MARWYFVLLVAFWVGGCRTDGGAGAPTTTSADGEQPRVDNRRAGLTLSEIKPDPPAPAAATEPIPELSESARRRLARSRERFAERRFTEASLELDKALRQDPNHPSLHRESALVKRALGSDEQVRAHVRQALSVDPDDIVCHYLLGSLAAGNQNDTEAIEHFRVALKTSNVVDHPEVAALTHFQLAKALNAEGYFTAAIEQYDAYEASADRLDRTNVVDPELVVLLQVNGGRAGAEKSVLFEKLGRLKDAAVVLAMSFEGRRPSAESRERLASLLMKSGAFDEALAQAKMLMDEPARATRLIRDIHARAGTPELAVGDVASMIDDDASVEWLISYASLLIEFDRDNEAESVLKDGLLRRPNDSRLTWRLIELYSARSAFSEVLAVAAAALRADPASHAAIEEKLVAVMSRSEDARVSLQRAADVAADNDSRDYATAFLVGSIFESTNQHRRAESHYRSAIEQASEFVPARLGLARLLNRRFAWRASIDVLSAVANEAHRGTEVEQLRGDAHAGLDRHDEAIFHYQEAVRLDRANIDVMASLAEVYLASDQPLKAQRQYESILDVNSLHEASREALIRLFLGREDVSAAADQLAELKRRSASPHRVARCEALVAKARDVVAHDVDAYRERLMAALDAHGPDATTQVDIARSFIAQDRAEAALEYVRLAIEADPRNTDALELHFLVQERLLEYPEAIAAIRSLLERYPNHESWKLELWRLLAIDQQYEESYRLALELLDQDELTDEERRSYRNRALLSLTRAGRHEDRISLLKKWGADAEDDLAPLLMEAYADAELFDEAIDIARARLNANPNNLKFIDDQYEIYNQAERFVAAQQLILSAMDVDPNNSQLHARLINTMVATKQVDDALELLDNVAPMIGNNDEVRFRRIGILGAAERFDDAIRIAEDWANDYAGDEFQGRQALPRDRLSLFLLVAGRYAEAAPKIRRFADEAQRPEVKAAFLQRLASCYQFLGRTDDAIGALEEAYNLSRQAQFQGQIDTVGISNDFGYMLADAGVRLDEAERLIRFAIYRQPENGAYLDSLGWVEYKKGNFSRAARWLEKAANRPQGADPVVLDHRGDALWRLGDKEEAKASWENALKEARAELETQQRADLSELVGRLEDKLTALTAGESPETAAVVIDADNGE